MKLADMKRTKTEKAAEQDRWGSLQAEPSEYHHGLEIELDHDGMRKVKMSEMPTPGDEYHGEFHGRVTHASEEAREGAEPQRRVRMVMHHLGVEPKSGTDEDKPRSGLRSSIEAAAEKADKAQTKAL